MTLIFCYSRFNAFHALIPITATPLKGAFCDASPSFFYFVRPETSETSVTLAYIDSFASLELESHSRPD